MMMVKTFTTFGNISRKKSNKELTSLSPRAFFETFLKLTDEFAQDEEYGVYPGDIFLGPTHGDLNAANIIVDYEANVWLIDFAKSTLKDHNMRDIAKLESCLIFEYTKITESTFDIAIEITDSLASMTDLRRAPKMPRCLENTAGRDEEFAPLRMLWKNVVLLREMAGVFSQTNPTALQFTIAAMSFALRCIRYRDISDLQKRWALRAAMSYAYAFAQCLNKNGVGLTLPSLFAGSTSSTETVSRNTSSDTNSITSSNIIGNSGLDTFDAKQYCLYVCVLQFYFSTH